MARLWRALLCALLFACLAPGALGQQVVINELMARNKATLQDANGKAPAWVELLNEGSSSVGLQGYKLTTQRDGSDAWPLPAVTLAADEFMLVYLDGQGFQDSSGALHAGIKLSKDPAEDYLALLGPDGVAVSAVQYPWMPTDVSFGKLGTRSRQGAAPTYGLLASPSPGAANGGRLRAGGPVVLGTTSSPTPRPDGTAGITVTTSAQPQSSPVEQVVLVYRAGYGKETAVAMQETPAGTYSATIPRELATPGALVRWYVEATDSDGDTTRDPPFLQPGDRQYYGTIVVDSSDSTSLFVLELYCPSANAPYQEAPTTGCSLLVNGTLYDNVQVSRSGTTSLQWLKPKMMVDTKQGSIIRLLKGWHPVSDLRLNSEWFESGENTFMRETLVWRVFREAGVEALQAFQARVRFNGEYFGKFAYSEQINADTLRGWGYDTSTVGPLWKAGPTGELSNLRWDLPVSQVAANWKKYTRKSTTSDDQKLVDFARGLSGGGPVVRSKFLFDAVNLPQVVNEMAAQTLILNPDRCTKLPASRHGVQNMWLYLDPSSDQWSNFPWDVESGFNIEHTLGGQPQDAYCILSCEQWNSPLFCDRNHPQDPGTGAVPSVDGRMGRRLLAASSGGWAGEGLVHLAARKALLDGKHNTTLSGTGCGARGGPGADGQAAARRALLQQGSYSWPYSTDSMGANGLENGALAEGPAASEQNGGGGAANGAGGGRSNAGSSQGPAAGSLSNALRQSVVTDYDADLTQQGATPTGAPGTFNYLIDAILTVPRTRQMYLRRLRSLMDQFIASGRLQALVTEAYQEVKGEAKRDAQKWGNSGDPDRGYQQLLQEQLPTRKAQLYDTYGPGGTVPLIPEAQAASPPLQLGAVQPGGSEAYIQVLNSNKIAVDVSGYSLVGPTQFTFRPGTVIPAGDSVYVAASISAFKQRAASPSGGEGHFVVGPLRGGALGSTGGLALKDKSGKVVTST